MKTQSPSHPIPEAVTAVAEAAHVAPSADNLQPVAFRYSENALILCHREARDPTFPARHPATLLAAGAALENAAQAAAALNIAADMSTPISAGDCYVRITLGEATKPALSHLKSQPLFRRHTNRHPYRPTPLPDSVMVRIGEMREGEVRIRLLRRPDEIRALAACTQVASEARFRTPEVHAWLGSSLRFTKADAARRDGLDVRTLDLPPGGRHFLRYIADWNRLERLNRIGAYKLLAAIEAQPIRRAPLLLAIIGNDPLSAGRLMERAWIELNAHGAAVQPFYVIPDQMERLQEGTVPLPLQDSVRVLDRDVRSLLGCGREEMLRMVLRAGMPTREPFRALRLPLQDVFAADLPD